MQAVLHESYELHEKELEDNQREVELGLVAFATGTRKDAIQSSYLWVTTPDKHEV